MTTVDVKSSSKISINEARQLNDEVEREALVPGANWYLIAHEWWMRFMELKDNPEQGDCIQLPPINNASLVVQTVTGYKLKPKLVEALNFVFVPEQVFNVLNNAFSVELPNRDIIFRQVVEGTLLEKKNFIELYPLEINEDLRKSFSDFETLYSEALRLELPVEFIDRLESAVKNFKQLIIPRLSDSQQSSTQVSTISSEQHSTSNVVVLDTQAKQSEINSIETLGDLDDWDDSDLQNTSNLTNFELDADNEIKKVCNKLQEIKLVEKISLKSMTLIKDIRAAKTSSFFNIICQVVGIFYLNKDFHRVHLRVTDGTTLTMAKPLNILADERLNCNKCKTVNPSLYKILRPSSVDIVCFDEYVQKAEACQPGDIVRIKNVRAHELDTVVSLKLNGNGERFGRSLDILERCKNSAAFPISVDQQPIQIPSAQSISTQSSTCVPETFQRPFTVLNNNEELDVKVFPIPESVIGTPPFKRSRIDDDSIVDESP